MNDTWTKETPKEPGYYWCYPEHGDEPFLVEVDEMFASKPGRALEMYVFGVDAPIPLTTYPKPLWAGPILPPAK